VYTIGPFPWPHRFEKYAALFVRVPSTFVPNLHRVIRIPVVSVPAHESRPEKKIDKWILESRLS
jgi:hypothetical protein